MDNTNNFPTKTVLSNIFLYFEMNSLAGEYYVFKSLQPGEPIPISLFLKDLQYRGKGDNLDIEGTYISETFCLNDVGYEYALYDLFSSSIELVLDDAYGNCARNEQGFIIFPPSISKYISDLFVLFSSILEKSLLLPFYETLASLPPPNLVEKKFTRIMVHNRKKRTEPDFLFALFSNFQIRNIGFRTRFCAQLDMLFKDNALFLNA